MAFVKRTWKDRISEFPNRRTINDGNVTKQVTVGRDEGNITEAGDPFDASNMNDLEQRIEDAYGDVQGLVASEVAQQYDSSNVIFDAEPTEGHGTGYTVTSEGIKTAIDSGLVHTNTASGSIVHITDGADNIPVKSLVSQIVAVETGNGQPKSPTNPYIISGFANGIITRCGKNWIDIANQAISANVSRTIVLGDIYLKAGTYTLSYTLSTNLTVTRNRPLYVLNGSNIYSPLDEKTSGRHSWTFTLLEDATILLRWWVVDNNNAFNLTDFQLEIGDTATTYEAYNGNTYTFPFGQTVYGGTLDVVSGVLTVTHAIATLNGSETWYIASDFAYTYPTGMKSGTAQTGWCSIAPTVSDIKAYGAMFGSSNTALYIGKALSTWNVSSVADIQTFLSNNPMQIVYPLATPQTYTLTPTEVNTLLGENNIFSNCGDVEVTFYVDTEAIYAIRDVIDEFAMQSDWNEADSTKADYIKNKPTIPANADFSLSGLSDTDISSPSAGQVLAFDGDNWVNGNIVLPSVKYEEIDVTLDSSGEGTLFNSVKFIVGLKDIPSDSLYVGYVSYIVASRTMVKAFSRSAIAFSSQNNVSSTRKVGVYYLDNITTE